MWGRATIRRRERSRDTCGERICASRSPAALSRYRLRNVGGSSPSSGIRSACTRIMIPLRFGSVAVLEGAGGHERGHIRRVGQAGVVRPASFARSDSDEYFYAGEGRAESFRVRARSSTTAPAVYRHAGDPPPGVGSWPLVRRCVAETNLHYSGARVCSIRPSPDPGKVRAWSPRRLASRAGQRSRRWSTGSERISPTRSSSRR